MAAALLAANLIMISLVAVPRSVLRGENLGYKRMGLSSILVFVGGGFTALALYFNTGLVGVAAATLATSLLTGAIFLQVVRAYVPWFGVAKPSFETVRRFLGLSSWFLVWNLVMKLIMASDVVILGIFDSAEMVTTYTLTKYVPETIISFVAISVFGIIPGLGGIVGSRDFQRATRVRGEIMIFTWLLVTVLGTTILMWNNTFVHLWVGTGYYAGMLPTLLMILMIIQLVLIRNDAVIIDLTLDLRHKVLIGLLSATLSLGIAWALVSYLNMGIVGLCLGFILGRSILSLGYPRLIGLYLDISFSAQLKSIIRPAFVTLLLFGFAVALQRVLRVDTWLGLIFSVGLTLTVIAPIVFLAGLSGDQRNQILRRGRQVLRPRA
jgi:O-antigen/teichoic acid export membrane protein